MGGKYDDGVINNTPLKLPDLNPLVTGKQVYGIFNNMSSETSELDPRVTQEYGVINNTSSHLLVHISPSPSRWESREN